MRSFRTFSARRSASSSPSSTPTPSRISIPGPIWATRLPSTSTAAWLTRWISAFTPPNLAQGRYLAGIAVRNRQLTVATQGDSDVVDITAQVQTLVDELGVAEGQALAFVRGSTAAVSTMEFEPGGIQDLRAMLERLIPTQGDYEHNRLNRDSNSHAHQRATVVGPSEVVPILDGRLALGTWQQLVLIDFDDRPRERTVVVHVTG